MSARHPLRTGAVWALAVWAFGSVVLFVAFIVAPFSETARDLATPGKHLTKRGSAREFTGRDTWPGREY